MKKLFAILCTTLLSVGVFAQAATEAGTFLLSGSTGLDFSSIGITGSDPSDYWDIVGIEHSQKTSNMELDLLGAMFIADGFALGLAVDYTTETTTSEYSAGTDSDSDKDVSSTMMIAPALRYYFGESGVWVHTQYGFGSMSSSWEYGQTTGGVTVNTSGDDSNPMTMLMFGAGYAIALSENISLNPSVGYVMATVTEKANNTPGEEAGYYNIITTQYEDLKMNMAGMTFKLGIALHLGN